MCVIVMILDYIGVNTALCSELMFHSCKAVMIVIEGFLICAKHAAVLKRTHYKRTCKQ